MKKILCALIVVMFSISSICFAGEWYETEEASTNDYVGSIGRVTSGSDAAEHTPKYADTSLQELMIESNAANDLESSIASSKSDVADDAVGGTTQDDQNIGEVENL